MWRQVSPYLHSQEPGRPGADPAGRIHDGLAAGTRAVVVLRQRPFAPVAIAVLGAEARQSALAHPGPDRQDGQGLQPDAEPPLP